MPFSDYWNTAKDLFTTAAKYAKDAAPIVEAVGTGYSIYDAYRNSNAADRAAQQSGATAAQQMALAEKQFGYGEEGGQALQAALAQWLEQAGDSGVFAPQRISELAAQYGRERSTELDEVLARAGGYTDASNQAASSLYDQYLNEGRAISSPYAVSASGRTARDLGFDLPTALRFSTGVPGLNDFYFSPEELGIDIPNVDTGFHAGTQDRVVNDLASGYLDRFSSETDRVLQDLYADQEVDAIRKGLDRSTYDLESKKATADVAARRRNQDVVAAVEAAMKDASARIGMDTSVQGANIADQGAGLSRAATQMNAFTTGQGYGGTVADDIYRQYTAATGRDTALQDDAYKRLAAQRDIYQTGAGADELAMRIAAQNYDQYLKGINTASGQLSNAQSFYGNAQNFGLNYTTGAEAARPNASAQAWNQAYDDMAKLQGLRGTTQTQLTSAITDPYKFMMSGATQAGNAYNSAGTTYGNMANTYAAQAAAAGKAGGQGLARFSDWKQT